jgi:hypothetical protein
VLPRGLRSSSIFDGSGVHVELEERREHRRADDGGAEGRPELLAGVVDARGAAPLFVGNAGQGDVGHLGEERGDAQAEHRELTDQVDASEAATNDPPGMPSDFAI